MSVATPSYPRPAGLPAWLAPLHQRTCELVDRLPVAPPSFLLAQVLDRVLLPRLPADARRALAARCVELRIVAPASSYIRLLRGEDDPDRLFFERALVMEGDTELGLMLKNTLDAIGPLWPRQPADARKRG